MRAGVSTAALALGGLLLAACGSSGGDTADPSAEPSASGSPEATSSILIWSDAAHAGALEASAAAHEEATGAAVVVETVGADLADVRDQFIQLAPQGQGPDLLVGLSDWVGRLADYGVLVPVDMAGRTANFRSVSTEAFTYQGRTYGLPFATDNVALLRNTDLAPDPPESIEVMARTGLELADENRKIVPIALPVGPAGDAYHWYPFYSAGGGQIFGSDPQGGYTADQVEVGQRGSIVAARQLARLTKDGALDPGLTADDALASFTAGRSPYLIAGPHSIDAVRQSDVPFVVEAVPGFDDVLGSRSEALVSAQGLLQSAFARNPADASQYLATTAMTTTVMSTLAAPGGLAPAWIASYELASSDAVISGFGDYADASAPLPNLAQMDLVWAPLSQAEADVMAGADPRRTLRATGVQIQAGIDAG